MTFTATFPSTRRITSPLVRFKLVIQIKLGWAKTNQAVDRRSFNSSFSNFSASFQKKKEEKIFVSLNRSYLEKNTWTNFVKKYLYKELSIIAVFENSKKYISHEF